MESILLAQTTVRVGTLDRKPVYLEVTIDAERRGPELHIVGYVWNAARRDWESGGQCLDTLAAVTEFAPGWNAAKRDQVLAIWRRWHLNGLRAGCEHQRALGWGNAQMSQPCPECGYRYGHEWKYEALPADVVQFIHQLATDHATAQPR